MRLSNVALLAALAVAPAAAEDLCRPHETPIFACRMVQTPDTRIASLCADKSQSPWRLTYLFGTPGHVDLTYPAAGETAAFRHAIISYASLGGDAVLFTRGPLTYALFYVLGHDTEFDGVAIRDSDTEIANLSCAPGSLDQLTTDVFQRAGLARESGQFEVPAVFFARYEKRKP